MNKTKQEKIIEMLSDFTKLSKENQVYVSGIVKGMSIKKTEDYQIHQLS